MSAGGGVLGRLAALEHEIRTLRLRVTSAQGGGVPAAPHATEHYDGADDEVDVTQLGGFPGGSPITYLDSNAEFTSPGAADLTAQITFTFDGNGATLETGATSYTRVPVACTITKAYLVADASGDLLIDVWADSFANFPPTNADSITGSAEPELTADQKYEDTTLTGWSTSLSAGDWIGASIEGTPATIQWAQLVLEVSVG